jgi:UDP-galactopyranose mutase
MKKYDFLIVGAGLYGSVFANEAKKANKKCLIIDKREHYGGNLYSEKIEGINVHKYGPHIFHTNDKFIWDYVNHFVEFNLYNHSPLAFYKDEVFNLPFNMNTFYKLWGLKTPEAAIKKINEQVKLSGIINPQNLEEQAIYLVGIDIYEKLIKGYTEKQWGCDAKDLPPQIIKRLPVRFTYDNNYFNDKYQGIPVGGYNNLIANLIDGVDLKLNTDFFKEREFYSNIADNIVFTGKIDEFYNYAFGTLEYRSLKFDTHVLDVENYQGNAVINYTDRQVPFTRIIEHKHFEYANHKKTVITYEYPDKWSLGKEAFYPINNNINNQLYKKYKILSEKSSNVIFGGRLAEYKYYDMHQIIASALKCAKQLFT